MLKSQTTFLRTFIHIPAITVTMLFATLLLAGSCSNLTQDSAGSTLPDKIDFNFHVKPILSDRCFKCHGPDENAREAKLRFDIKEDAFAPLDSGDSHYAILPYKPMASEMVKRTSSNDPEYMMPPPDSKLSLSAYEIDVLKKWIDQGAEWKDHWAYIPPQKAEVPSRTKKWVTNAIDHFVLQRLKRENYKPAKRASPEKLIRRLSFDLRGIPPTLEEIDDFLSDGSANAYENIVDQFLADKHYGERMTLEWLDVARYADSHGYQDDLERAMWPWRDWVIKAFNENISYDRFVSWQLAGDLLPDATYEQKLATGFNRNHKITQEVGVVDEEYRVEYVLDRVNTFSTAFLGLTVACAQCHDHKFDPISQKEYYELFGFFNNVPEEGRVEYGVEVAEPAIAIPDSTVQKYKNYIKKLVTSQEKRVDDYEEERWEAYKEVKFEEDAVAAPGRIPKGLVAYYPFDYLDGDKVNEETTSAGKGMAINGPVPMPGKYSGGFEFTGENFFELDDQQRRRLSSFTFSFWLYSIESGARGVILTPKFVGKDQKPAFELGAYDDAIRFVLYDPRSPRKTLGAETTHILPANKWAHIAIAYDGTRHPDGISIYLDGVPQKLNTYGELSSKFSIPFEFFVGRKSSEDGWRRVERSGLIRTRLDELMIFDRELSRKEVESLVHFNPLAQMSAESSLTEHQQIRLFYHQLHHHDPTYRQMTQWLSEYKFRQMRTNTVIMNPTMVMAEMDTVRPTFVLDRGSYSAPTDTVLPGTPKVVLPFPAEYPQNRLGLAQWLFDERNPLTSRVAVNRYWQMIFGRGLVTTPEDFGSQGDLPSHPELLDWLASDFSTSWDVKKLIKTMVMSSTYRQDVEVSPRLQKRDPENILLARGPQNRLPAELVRDHALSISGLLSDEMGGPSVKPYQPKGLWLQVASGNQPLKEYIQDHGQDLYRKSMYSFWKRSLPPPSMITFDASTREQCSVERQSTSTPMQALVLLNDPQFMEASRLLAQRMLTEGGQEESDRIRFAFRLATSRQPAQEELQLLQSLLDDQRKVFSSQPEKAEDLLRIGEYPADPQLEIPELASYTVVANAIMNLTESISKG